MKMCERGGGFRPFAAPFRRRGMPFHRRRGHLRDGDKAFRDRSPSIRGRRVAIFYRRVPGGGRKEHFSDDGIATRDSEVAACGLGVAVCDHKVHVCHRKLGKCGFRDAMRERRGLGDEADGRKQISSGRKASGVDSTRENCHFANGSSPNPVKYMAQCDNLVSTHRGILP
jgi:hypothetical protein